MPRPGIGFDSLAQHPLDDAPDGRLFGKGAGGEATLIGFVKASAESSYAAIVPGLIISGVGQGVVWTAMWIAAASGVAHDEQGVASGMACTTLNIGNAIGMATLIAIASSHVGGLTGEALKAAIADGIQVAFWLAAAGIVISLLAAMVLPRKAKQAL